MATSELTPTRTTSKALTPNLKAPTSSVAVATELARFIKEKRLSSNIQGKEYVQVEGWQFAGSQLGIVPILGEVLDLSTPDELRYRASVTLYDLHNKLGLGGGVAECSNKERTKRGYERYAICSMAQTRAVGKAYRNVLAWLIKAAGFEATPYEEMLDVVLAGEAGTSAEVVPAQGKPAGGSATSSEPPVTPAVSSSAAPVASAGAEATRSRKTLGLELLAVLDVLDRDAGAKDAERDGHRGSVNGMDVTRLTELLAHYRAQVLPRASDSQKEEIIRLLNSPAITRQEKTKMLLNINRMNEPRATQAIDKLRQAIEEREGPSVFFDKPVEAEADVTDPYA